MFKSLKDGNSTQKPEASTKIETFELSEKDHPYIPVSTTRILSKFTRDPPPEIPYAKLEKRLLALQSHADTVEQLREWAKHRKNSRAFKMLLRFLRKDTKINFPSEPKLYAAVNYFFPPRMMLMATVCDFGDGRAERHEVRLGDIEQAFREKPSWATVRWIHAPLGIGLLHSTVEALFFHTGSKVMGRPFIHAGRAGWPYLETETFDLRNLKSIQDSRDLLRLLKARKDVRRRLDNGLFDGDKNVNLRKDLEWRAQFVGKPLDFLELAEADIPWQISEGSNLNMNGVSEGVRTAKLEKSAESLTRSPFFKDSYIARNPLRCFNRDDGFLLTMSPAAGVDYLNSNLPHYLNSTRPELAAENFASSIAQVFLEFSESGTRHWYQRSVEWFMVYLITELGSTPHNIRQGYSVPSLMDAFDAIVHELKERRYDRWQKNQTIDLVRAYLVCIDELKVLEEIFTKKLDFFQRLRKDCDALQESTIDHYPINVEGETYSDRIAFAEHLMKESAEQCQRLNADLRESLDSLFQLRSIEQNELAIIADSQNKAIFVFTGVTIVFLPLSFFTSYFGMNFKGLDETDRTETYFWKVCGSATVCIVLSICAYAFRYQIRHRVWSYRAQKQTLDV